MSEAQAFLKEGEQALNDGDQNKAQRDFRAAERAGSMNETFQCVGLVESGIGRQRLIFTGGARSVPPRALFF